MSERYEAMLGLEASGRLRDVELKNLCLRDVDPFIRKRALRLLGETRGEAGLSILREALADGDPMVRIVAAEQVFALAEERERIPLQDILKPLFRDADPGVRSRALSLLIRSQEKGALDLLVELFFETLEESDSAAPTQIANLLAMIMGRRTDRQLRKRFDRLDEETRSRAERALEAGGIDLS
jgi:HEAT repeat protein